MVSRISEPSAVPWVVTPALSKESVEGKRYKVEGKRYNLCNKTSDDDDSPWTGTRGSELNIRSSCSETYRILIFW